MKKLLIVLAIIIPIIVIGLVFFLFNKTNPLLQPTQLLELSVTNTKREVYQPYTEVSISAPVEIELKVGPQTSIFKIGEKDGRHYYIAKVNDVPGGTTTRKLLFTGSDGSEGEVELELTKVSVNLPFGYDSIDAWEESSYIISPDLLSMHRFLQV